MKEMLYLSLIDCMSPTEIGVVKKIRGQKKAFEELGYNVEVQFYKNLKRYEKVGKKILFKKLLVEKQYDLIYIRKPIITKSFINLLKKISKLYESKVVIEIPTYPYLSEKQGLIKKMIYKHEESQIKKLSNYVDLITYYGTPTDKIWDIDTLELQNGIDMSEIPEIFNYKDKKLNVVALGNISVWHGYDRFFKSLAKYREKESVVLHVIGEGSELKNLKKLSEDLKLNKQIIFHGKKIGTDLTEILKKCEIGIDSLGRHRSGNNHNSSLKSKEYLAYGLKIIKSHIDIALIGCEYVYDVEASEELFDIESIVEWHEKKSFKRNKIQKYARKEFAWLNQLKIVDKKLF